MCVWGELFAFWSPTSLLLLLLFFSLSLSIYYLQDVENFVRLSVGKMSARAKCTPFDTGTNKKNMKEINMIDAKQPAHTKQIHSHTQKESLLVANASFFHCDREKSISRLIDVGNVNDISFAFTLRKWLIVRHIDVTFLLAVSIAILRDQIKYSVREKTNRNSLRI